MATKILLLTLLSSLGELSLAQSCSSVWGQCGGLGYTGATCCVSGSTCVVLNPYYSQCQPGTTTSAGATTSSRTTTSAGTGGGGTTGAPSPTGPVTYTTTDTTTVASHSQAAYPSVSASSCGAWTLFDNVCCPSYCSNDRLSESCHDGCPCVTPPDSDDCSSSDQYTEVHHVTTNENWHYSRSTHFGLTSGGACGFGLYGLCTRGSATSSWTDPMLGSTCTAFCNAYPQLCKDPSSASNATLRGNFAAPNGNYYSQFWSSLAGLRDNYLSCGECFQVIRTKPDGTDYAVGEAGYTDPITLEIVDSCPCSANSKWCCGPEADHCGEISFKYGCPLPAGSIHLDLSDIAMGRLQGGGSLADGVIPTRYRRVPCPKPGNAYIWLREGGGPYYFALSVVNTAGVGSVTKVEVRSGGQGQWVALQRDPNYTSSRPQERYGAWVLPSGQGPLNVPVGLRVTSPTGEQIVNEAAITSWTPPATAVAGFWYIDLGVQFSVN